MISFEVVQCWQVIRAWRLHKWRLESFKSPSEKANNQWTMLLDSELCSCRVLIDTASRSLRLGFCLRICVHLIRASHQLAGKESCTFPKHPDVRRRDHLYDVYVQLNIYRKPARGHFCSSKMVLFLLVQSQSSMDMTLMASATTDSKYTTLITFENGTLIAAAIFYLPSPFNLPYLFRFRFKDCSSQM